MAIPRDPPPAIQLVALFSRHAEAIEWGMQRIEQHWGHVILKSESFEHSETDYYTADMGSGLRKQFVTVAGRYDPARLPDAKLLSNAWEVELAAQSNYPDIRPVNIDPGYLTLTKLVLASAKDRAHRLYMAQGIYAEECLYYLGDQWRSRPWTYPDYKRPDFQRFFVEARELLKVHINTEEWD